jgi:hypothetical protein
MVLIVENIEEISVEGVDVLNLREVVQNVHQLLHNDFLAELDLNKAGLTLRM